MPVLPEHPKMPRLREWWERRHLGEGFHIVTWASLEEAARADAVELLEAARSEDKRRIAELEALKAQPAARACELLTIEERAEVIATWRARHKGACAADETWALNNLACDLNQAQREKCQKGQP